jgi:hypothetical protein
MTTVRYESGARRQGIFTTPFETIEPRGSLNIQLGRQLASLRRMGLDSTDLGREHGKNSRRPTRPFQSVTALATIPEMNRYLVSVGDDGELRIWDIIDLQPVSSLRVAHALGNVVGGSGGHIVPAGDRGPYFFAMTDPAPTGAVRRQRRTPCRAGAPAAAVAGVISPTRRHPPPAKE